MASPEEKLLPNFLDEIFTEIREEEQHHSAAETVSLPGSLITCYELRSRHISSGSTVSILFLEFLDSRT